MTTIEELQAEITSKQTDLEMMREQGDLAACAKLEDDIDALQRKFARLKEGGSFKYEDRVTANMGKPLPDIDEQIAYMESVCKCEPLATSIEMMQAILGSLRAAKLFSKADPLAEPEMVIKTIGRPYDTEAQRKFLAELIARLPLSNDTQRELKIMYTAITDSVYVMQWVGKAAADHLLSLPGNLPEPKEETQEGLANIFLVKEDNSYVATREGYDIRALGVTELMAVTNLINEIERRKQHKLFGKEDGNE